jgi:hypothetical protein
MLQPRFVRELLNARSPKVEFAENTALIPFATATTNNHNKRNEPGVWQRGRDDTHTRLL